MGKCFINRNQKKYLLITITLTINHTMTHIRCNQGAGLGWRHPNNL